MDQQTYRLYVGGLFPLVTSEELRGKFKSFGTVTDVALIQRKDNDGCVSKTFGYVSLESTLSKVNKCFALFGGTKWKGHSLKVQLAKEDFMARLEQERKNPEQPLKKSKRKTVEPMKRYIDLVKKSSEMKRAVPGTPVVGEKDWVIGKYGRPLPIVSVRKYVGCKPVKIDPSKHCHCLRKIVSNEDTIETNISDLTWTLNDDDGNLDGRNRRKRNKVYVDTTLKNDELKQPSSKKRKKKEHDKTLHDTDWSFADVEKQRENNIEKESQKRKKKKNLDRSSDINEEASSKDFETGEGKFVHEEKKESTKKTKKKSLKKVHEEFSVEETRWETKNVTENEVDADLLSQSSENDNNEKQEQMITDKNTENEIDSSCEQISATNSLSTSIVDQLLNKSVSMSIQNANNNGNVSQTTDGVADATKESSTEDESDSEAINLFDFTFDNLNEQTNCEREKENSESEGEGEFLEKYNAEMATKKLVRKKNTNVPPVLSSSESNDVLGIPKGSETVNGLDSTDMNFFDFAFDSSSNKKLYSYEFTTKYESEEEQSSDSVSEEEQNSDSESVSSDIEDGEIKKTLKQVTANTNKDDVSSSKNIDNCPKKVIHATLRKENEEHKMLSEEARINSLKLRERKSLKNKEAVQAALKSIDESTSCANRIVFSENESESEIAVSMSAGNDADTDINMDKEKETLKRSLFDDSDDNNDDEDDEVIPLKPQFQGAAGQKLFKLQQRIGGDERFRLDERFAEDEDKITVTGDVKMRDDVDVSDAANFDLHEEKRKNMSVLEQILGKSIDDKSTKGKASDKTFERYDPTGENHEQFEIQSNKLIKDESQETSEEEEEEKEENAEKPVVSSKKFYVVDESLKNLFADSNQEAFSFLGATSNAEVNEKEQFENVESPEEEVQPTNDISNRELSWMKALEETHKQTYEEENVVEQIREDRDDKHVDFFFSVDDKRFEIGKNFVRTSTIEEITDQWRALRRNLNEDCRKKHKDAIRRVRKLKERRFSRK